MNLHLDPAQRSPDQLLELVRQLLAENVRLRAEIEELKRKNARSAAPFSKNNRKSHRKRPGRKPGQGRFSYRPAPSADEYSGPVEEVRVNETTCPACGGDLSDDGREVVTNTELPPTPKPEVKAYRIYIRSCGRCQRKVRGRHPEVASDQGGATAHRLGPRAQAAAAMLHYGEGVTQRKVPGVLKSLTGLVVTQGALTHMALRVGTGAGPVARRYEQLREQLPGQEAINTDDTGWRVGGEAAHLMAFEGQEATVYQIRAQHRNEEVREVIGDHYPGILGTDRGKSYDAQELQGVKQQKCLAHIQRSIDAVVQTKRRQARGFGTELKALLQEATELYKAFQDPAKKLRDYDRRVSAIEWQVSHHLRERERPLKDADNERLRKELCRHHERGNLLRFLHDPTVIGPTNNAAERALRPAVIARKVSHCSKTAQGAEAFSAFKSVIQTIKKQGGNLLETLADLIRPSPPPETDFQALN
jgi:transposase